MRILIFGVAAINLSNKVNYSGRFLHTGTRARFIANGAKSRLIAVISWNCQGSSLPPQLCILALDPLYRKIDKDTQLPGIKIRNKGGEFELSIGGHADDTTSYLQNHKVVPRLLEVTDQFGRASGL